MIALRPAEERGHAHHGWLDPRFTFLFVDSVRCKRTKNWLNSIPI